MESESSKYLRLIINFNYPYFVLDILSMSSLLFKIKEHIFLTSYLFITGSHQLLGIVHNNHSDN